MKNRLNDLSLFLLFWASLFYLESVTIISLNPSLQSINLQFFIYAFLFAAPFAFIPYIISSVFKRKNARFVILLIFLIFYTLIFATELFSKAFFRTYMSIESILYGGKGIFTDFALETLQFVGKRFYLVLLLLLPLAGFILLKVFKKILTGPPYAYSRLLSLGLCLFGFFAAVFLVYFDEGTKILYTENYDFDTSAESFGISTAFRLDAKNIIFGDKGNDSFEVIADESINTDTEAGNDSLSSGIAKTENTETTESIETNGDTKNSEQIEYGDNTWDISDSVIEIKEIENLSEAEPEEIVYGKHDCGIDFSLLAESETDSSFKSIDNYIASLEPSSENEYTGIFKGKNLIFISAEAFSAEVIDEELTPALYRLATKGINFTNYYQPVWGGSTSTGEYSNLTGLIPAWGVASMKKTADKNMYYTMGNFLRREGYFSRAFHGHDYKYYGRDLTHENIGYDLYLGRGNGLEDFIKNQWPESDLETVHATIDMYIDESPFSVYYMSISGHTYYNWRGNAMSYKNKDKVKNLNVPDPIKCYIACNLEFEYSMEYMLSCLEEKGLMDNTVIVIANDHYPFGLESESSMAYKNALGDLYGYDYTTPWERDHNRLIIWCGSLEKEEPIVVDDPVYSLDIVPTLANLFGVDFDSRLYVGRDVFSDAEPLVIWANYNWMTDKACQTGGKTTIFEGYEDEVDSAYIKRISSAVTNKFNFSKKVIENNYYDHLFAGTEQ